MAKFYWLSVKEIRKETLNAVSITFAVPDQLKETFSFIPGQYITLQKEIDGALVRRDYSICCSQGSGELKVGIKAVENGLFSVYATTQLKEGDQIEVAPPNGRFNLRTDSSSSNKYLAFAAGSGITPILSMISSVLQDEPKSSFVLVYGNKNKEEVMFQNELQALLLNYPDQLAIHYTFSQANYENYHSGRIDSRYVNHILDELNPNVTFDQYFLCGPEAMIMLVKDTLQERKVEESAIQFELFTASTTNEIEEEVFDGTAQVTVLLDDDEESFSMPTSSTILEGALLEGLDAPYSCQGGICSTCIAQVTSGSAVMEKNSILSEEEVAQGLILTCQAHPTSSKIVVDYDNV